MSGRAGARVALLTVVFVLPAVYLVWQALADPQIEFLAPSLRADWALHPEQGVRDLRARPVSHDLLFRRRFELERIPDRVLLRYRAFRHASLALNGVRLDVPAPASWKRTVEVELTPHLRAGANLLELRLHNPGAVPALLVTSPPWLRTSADWQVALDSAPEATAAAVTPWTAPPRYHDFYRAEPSPLAARVGRPLLQWLVLAWLALLALLGVWLWRGRAEVDPTSDAVARGRSQLPLRLSRELPSLLVLGLSLAFQLWNAWLYPPERSFVDGLDHREYVRTVAQQPGVPTARDGFQMYQPPAYYWTAGLFYRLAGGEAQEERALEAVQLVGALAGFTLVLVTWLLSRRLFDDEASRVAATAFAACVPMLLYTSPTVSNESFAAAAAGLALYALARPGVGASSGRAAWAGLLCALALLSKYSGLFVTLAGVLLLLPAAAESRDGGRLRWRPLAGFALVVLLLAGWLYVRNLAEFGDPFVGNWDEASGFHYEQDPGYRSLGFYLRFGRVFSEPIEHAPWLSFADGIYATLWGEAHRSFLNPADDRARLLVGISLLLAAWPSLLLLLGFADTLQRALRRPFADAELLLVAVPVWSVTALLSFTLEVPFYSTVKAFFLLSLVPVLGIQLARGRRMLASRPRALRATGDLALIALCALNLTLYRYAPEPEAMRLLREAREADADAVGNLVPDVHADQQGGDRLDDARVRERAPVDGPQARDQ